MARPKKEIIVKVARTGSPVIEVCLNGDRTVEEAINISGLEMKASEEIKVNGKSADEDKELKDGDRIILVREIEGGKGF